MTVVRNEYDLYLELDLAKVGGEVTRYRVSKFTASYALNKIPTATCALAVGRNVRTLEPAQIHRDADKMKLMLPAKIYFTGSGPWTPFNDFGWDEAGTQVLFDGYLTGIGYSQIQGKLQLTVQLIHWLSDLAFSSSLSEQSHPSNPFDIAFRASYLPPCPDLVTTAKPAMTSEARFQPFFDRDKITQDLWGKVLHPLFCCLAQEDAIRLGLCTDEVGEPGRNDQALSALERFETDAESDCGVPRIWSKPLAMDGGIVGNAFAKGVRQYFARELVESFAGMTIWDKLIQAYGAAFKFAVVPRPESAMVVPFVPGIRLPWIKKILPDDIRQIDATSFIRRPIRGVGIWAGRDFRTAAYGRQTANLYAPLGVGGCYLPDPEAKGMLLIRRAPGWLANVPAAAGDARTTMIGGKDGARRPTSTATTPQEGNEEALRPDEGPVEAAKNSANIFENLAHWTYMAEVLRGRVVVVTTKLRFDIAPGSNVQVQAVGEPFIQSLLGADALRLDLLGTVTRVVTTLDAENRIGQTTFQLAHVRTVSENEDDRTSLDRHPLYPESEVFSGAPLVDGFLFE